MNHIAGSTMKIPAEPERPAECLTPWLRLLAGVAVILLVMFGVGPLLLRLPWYGEMNRFIESEGIRSTAIYYTDLETFRNAEFDLRQNMEYGPLNTTNKGP